MARNLLCEAVWFAIYAFLFVCLCQLSPPACLCFVCNVLCDVVWFGICVCVVVLCGVLNVFVCSR